MEPLIVYFSSVTETTKRFVDKLPFESRRLPLRRNDPKVVGDRPYILIVPTYGGRVESPAIIPKQVIKFLNEEENRNNCIGVMASGNANFGESFLLAGKQVAQKLDVPMLFGFELAGTSEDVDKVVRGIPEYYKNYDK